MARRNSGMTVNTLGPADGYIGPAIARVDVRGDRGADILTFSLVVVILEPLSIC